jgi:hypothetical protein
MNLAGFFVQSHAAVYVDQRLQLFPTIERPVISAQDEIQQIRQWPSDREE